MAASSEINNELSSSNPSSLPLDVVSDILLPVKTLSRLKLVSKSWLSLISSPSFKSSHRRRSERNPLLVATSESNGGGYRRTHFHVLDYYNKRGKALLDRVTTTGYYLLRASWFDRRLVFSCCRLDLVCMYDPDDIYIRNPVTEVQIALPRKSSGFPGQGGRAVAFAYLPSTGEYKVLCVFGASPFFSLQHPIRRSEVFTLGSGRWREIKEGPPFGFMTRVGSSSTKPSISCQVFLHGGWLSVTCTTTMRQYPGSISRGRNGRSYRCPA